MSSYRLMLDWGRKQLKEKEISDWELDAWYLLEEVSGMDRASYFLRCDENMPAAQMQTYKQWIGLRCSHMPLQHIIGKAWFMGLEFSVSPDVLVPRQDTEVLVEEAQKRLLPGMRILDLCTGSGCILLALLANRADITGVGSDISAAALEVAAGNACRMEAQGLLKKGQADWICSDLFENLSGAFSMIISNPPYIPTFVLEELMPEVRDHDPVNALDGGQDGLDFYRQIVSHSTEYLEPGGWLFFEIGYDQGEKVSALMEAEKYGEINIIKDLAGLDRVVMGQRPGNQEERNSCLTN